ncbi:MAG: matrixin family metalloprotease [Nanoarchaeota archaeon]
MSWKKVLGFIFFLVVIGLLTFYWFIPVQELQLRTSGPKDTNFTMNSSSEENMQFYNNMRFPEPRISYRIENCPLQKADDMKNAFFTIENKTILRFYPVSNNEEILVTCDSKAKFEGDLFIAGEGGPTNITQSGDFNVITKGAVTLLRDSTCENPNVAIHELLHVLGFDHSKNKNNIMYNLSKCNQEIGQDTINFIDEIYAIPSLPDLTFENASASMKGRYLDVNISIRNEGLKSSESGKITIYADNKSIKELELKSLPVGSGRLVYLTNILVVQTSVRELRLVINYNFEELKKENNLIALEIK